MVGKGLKRTAAGFLGLALGCGPALAWGPEGHAIVALVAEAHLTPTARRQASALLGGPNRLVLDADWADEVRDARPETAPWHYVNIPLAAAGYDAARDCPKGDCAVAQINRDAQILADRRVPPARRAEALRFLIHLVADIHQPLHAGDDHDRGGNDRVLFFKGKRTNLHRIWDNDVIGAFGPDPFPAALAIDQGPRPAADGSAADWANESLGAAKAIYAPLHTPYLPRDYPARWKAMTRARLEKAGLRLAALLNRILR